ncbi:TPA: hypothetical protein ACGCAJ_004722 [Serratia marcescens]
MSGDLMIVGLGWTAIAVTLLIVRLVIRFTFERSHDAQSVLLYCAQRVFGGLVVYALLSVVAVLICRFTPALCDYL